MMKHAVIIVYPAFAGWSGDFERTCDGSGLKFRSLRGIKWGGNGGPDG